MEKTQVLLLGNFVPRPSLLRVTDLFYHFGFYLHFNFRMCPLPTPNCNLNLVFWDFSLPSIVFGTCLGTEQRFSDYLNELGGSTTSRKPWGKTLQWATRRHAASRPLYYLWSFHLAARCLSDHTPGITSHSELGVSVSGFLSMVSFPFFSPLP